MLKQYSFQVVDSIQTTKKQVVTTLVKHPEFQKVLNTFVDAQTEYTKSAITAGSEAMSKTIEIAMDRTPFIDLANKFFEFFPHTNFSRK